MVNNGQNLVNVLKERPIRIVPRVCTRSNHFYLPPRRAVVLLSASRSLIRKDVRTNGRRNEHKRTEKNGVSRGRATAQLLLQRVAAAAADSGAAAVAVVLQ